MVISFECMSVCRYKPHIRLADQKGNLMLCQRLYDFESGAAIDIDRKGSHCFIKQLKTDIGKCCRG
jgi:hypothetical protein